VREARVTAQLEHPNIVPVHDAGTDDAGKLYYTMKYVRGASLGAALAKTRSLAERLQFVDALVDAVQGMAYAHSRGVLHRDLKPDNIMVGAFGETLVVDWGLARALDDLGERLQTVDEPTDSAPADPLDLAGSGQTVLGGIAGTPAYMAPEQARGEALTPATDVFGLGAILYQLLTGRPPYSGSPHDALRQASRCGWRRIASVEPGAPPELVAIAEKALAARPADRYADAAALLEDLEDWQHGRRVAAHTYSSTELMKRFVSRHRAPLAALGTGLVLALAVGVMGYLSTVRERDAAIAARHEAEVALGRSYQARAEAAARDRTPAEAQMYAAAALSIREDPVSRGILARYSGVPVLQSDTGPGLDVPCQYVTPAGEGRLLCSGVETTLLDADGTILWSAPDGGRSTDRSDASVLQVVDNIRILHRSLVDGRILGRFDGSYATFAPDGAIWVLARRTLMVVRPDGSSETYEGPGSLTVAAHFLPDGVLRVFGVSGQVEDIRVDDFTRTLVRPGDQITYVGKPFPTDSGTTWIRAGERLEWWDAQLKGEPLAVLDTGHAVLSVDVRDGLVAAADTSGRTWLWDPKHGAIRGSAHTHEQLAWVAFFGDRLAVSGGALSWWRPTPGVPHSMVIGEDKATGVSPDGRALVVCGEGGWSGVIDLDSMALRWSRTSGTARHNACGWVDSSTVYVAPSTEAIRSAVDGRGVASVAQVALPDSLEFDFRAGDGRFAIGRSGIVVDLHTGESVAQLDGLLYAVADDPDGALATTKSGLVRLAPPAEPAPVSLGRSGFLVHRTERFDLVSDSGSLSLYARATEAGGESVCTFDGHIGVPLITDGYLVMPRPDSRITVAKLPEPGHTGCPVVAELTGHTRRVIRVHAHGDTLVSTSYDGTIRRWSLSALDQPPGEVSETVEALSGIALENGEVRRVHTSIE
jgi:hypothetical protein